MRQIHQIIFMGQGLMSLRKVYKVHKILDKAFSDLGGIQQPQHSSSEKEAKEAKRIREEVNEEIEDAVGDITMALTGKEVK